MKNKDQLKKFIADFCFTFIASILPALILQFVIQPIFGRMMSIDEFGTCIFFVGIINLISGIFGNAISHSLLIEASNVSDLNNHAGAMTVIALLIETVICLCFLVQQNFNFILLLFITTAFATIDYVYQTKFRIELCFNNILLNKIFLVIGFSIGIILYIRFKISWIVVYLMGFLFTLIWDLFKAYKFIKFSFKTKISKTLLYRYSTLILSNTANDSGNYIDRMIIFPVLGSELLSVYYSGSITGKVVQLVVSPLSTLIMSYICKLKDISKKFITTFILSDLVLTFLVSVSCYLISPFIVKLLYPQFFDYVSKYLLLIIIGISFQQTYSLWNPVVVLVLTPFQSMLIHYIYLAVYGMLAFVLTTKYSLTGFCLALIISAILRYIISFILISIKKVKK